MNKVEEKKRVQRTSAGVNGSKEVHAASDPDDNAGDSGARMGKNVRMIYNEVIQCVKTLLILLEAYPEGLFAQEIGMPRPSPQAFGDETTLHISRCPLQVREWPIILFENASVLVGLEGILLIVGSEFDREINQGEGCKDVIRSAELRGLLENCDIGGDAEQE